MSGSNVSAFEQNYQGAAIVAGNALGVSPALVLSQWALESGYGTAQGNNLAGIQTQGVNRTYGSLDAFVQDYVSTIQTNFPGAVGAGSNADTFVTALANGQLGSYFGTQSASSYEAGVLGASSALSAVTPPGSVLGSVFGTNNGMPQGNNLGDPVGGQVDQGTLLGVGPTGTSPTGVATLPTTPAGACGGGVTGLEGIFTWSCWSAIAADAGLIVMGLGMILIGVVAGVRGSPVQVITGRAPSP